MNRKGFTSIEVIGALMALCIIMVPVLELSSAAVHSSLRNKYLDEEYNIACSVCDLFRNETISVPTRKVVVFIDDINELNTSISDLIIGGNTIENTEISVLSGLNYNNKDFGVVISSYQWDRLSFISVTVTSMKSMNTNVMLRAGR